LHVIGVDQLGFRIFHHYTVRYCIYFCL
jgi:hypothetical protein